MVCSSSMSDEAGLWARQVSEQNLMLGQSRSHFLRQVMVRPQVAQVLGCGRPDVGCGLGLRSGMGVEVRVVWPGGSDAVGWAVRPCARMVGYWT